MPQRPPFSVSALSIESLLETSTIESLLTPWVSNVEDRQFIARCLLRSGPAHHRGANFVLLSLLGEVLQRLPEPMPQVRVATPIEPCVPIPLRLPPHLAEHTSDRYFPLQMSLGPLQKLAGGDEHAVAVMVDCLTDGPAQHALANAVMVNVLARILDALTPSRS